MNDLNATFQNCKMLLDNLQVPYSKGITISVNNRLQNRTLGRCRLERGHYSIQINKALLTSPVHALENTILHELIHSCPGCFDHGETWKRWCSVVNATGRYNLKRTTSATQEGIVFNVENLAPYRFRCKGCGQIVNRTRRSDFVVNYNNYRCAICKSGFEPYMGV